MSGQENQVQLDNPNKLEPPPPPPPSPLNKGQTKSVILGIFSRFLQEYLFLSILLFQSK